MKDYLEHHGILGQKWGVRRYQNPDGTLTPAGRKRLHSLYDENGHLTSKGQEYSDYIHKAKAYEELKKGKNSDRYDVKHLSSDERESLRILSQLEANDAYNSLSKTGKIFAAELLKDPKFKSSLYSPMSMNELYEDDKYGYSKDIAEIKLMEKLEKEEEEELRRS